ncbi:sporulation protein [Bacillus mesophilus]|uniref:Sporulation protein n=2 Tax=Bacillus mesophilus TaxID=1808955 RepID=A0A6M0Q3K5_9BACI|nr:sporulation protein [Bacillus mesophilus]
MDMSDMFKGVEKKTGVKMQDIMKVAQSLNGANLKDEKTIRGLVKELAQLANKNVPKQLEDKIVDTLVNKNQPIDASTISKMLKK